MSSEWPLIALEKLSINFDSRRKPVKESERRKGSYPYYGASGIVDYVDGYIFEGEHLLVAEDGENLRTRQTPIAFLADGKFWVNNHAHIVTGNNFCRTKFLKYSLLATDISPYLTGAVMPKLTKANLNAIELPCPSLHEQDAIIGVLGSLDDRITLLRETNATLEAIAKALFKSWFVDFDPVHAKQQGRAPEGMDGQTAALFPDSFEESELGMVPKGWRVQACQEVIDVRDGTHDSPKPTTDGYPLITSRHIISGQVDFKETYLISAQDYEAISKRSQVNRLDVLITMIGTVGATAILLNEKNDFAIKNIGLFKTSLVPNFAYFIVLLLKSAKMQNYISERLAGTTQKYISLKALRAIPLVVPSEIVLNEFSKNASSFFEKIHLNNLQINSLEGLRDTLLPRLISGQLRLPEAQALVEEATAA